MDEFIPKFHDPKSAAAIKKLVVYSLLIIFVPLGSMFLVKKYLFEGILHYSSSDAVLYAAIVAVVLVHVVLISFVYVAWKEDEQPAPIFLRPPGKQD